MNLVTTELTAEEEILLKKYAKLHKKKKSLSLRQSKLDSKDNESLKRSASEFAIIDEQAKKLAKLAVMKEALENKEKVFKRPVVKKQEKQKPEYRPFDDLDVIPQVHKIESSGDVATELISQKKEDYRNQYMRFQKSSHHEPGESQREGHSIYVVGTTEFKFTNENLRRIFGVHGTIINIKVEQKRAFICFEKKESVDMAIEQLNNTLVNNVQLKVGVAMRQPIFNSNHNLDEPAPSSDSWSTQAASSVQKSSVEDKRQLISYSEDLF